MGILQTLRQWRDTQARTEGVETFRVFPNAVLEALSSTLPQNKEEMLSIKGIKDGKYRKYGTVLLKIIQGETTHKSSAESDANDKGERSQEQGGRGDEEQEGKQADEDQTLSVSQFLDGLNTELSGMASRVQGEVSSVDERERVVYFTLKDSKDESTLNCLIFRYQYEISGVKIVSGDEIIVEGSPEIYKPSGRLSLKVGMIELAGEGALQKAYVALRLKLEQEGLFAPERKRVLPEFSERIALITSQQGAAIGDFTMNLGAQGLSVALYPTSVEGKRAVFEIIKAIGYFNQHPEKYDVLVIVRGGGSLESLQAFNNEALVREVALSKIPTLLGVGHEKDVTLAALVADIMVSTPTATARTLRAPWDQARQVIQHFQSKLPLLFASELIQAKNTLALQGEALIGYARTVRERLETLKQSLVERVLLGQSLVREKMMYLDQEEKNLKQGFRVLLKKIVEILTQADVRLKQHDPKRALKLGYSLIRKGGKIMKDVSEFSVGDSVDLQLSRGRLETKVEKIFEN